MKNRIKEIRKSENLTQTAFGERIGVKGNTVTNYETGLRNPTDAVLLSICKEFGINEDWLRYGKGEMRIQLSRDEEIARFVAKVLQKEDDSYIKRLFASFAKMSESDVEELEKVLQKIVNGMDDK